MSELLTKKNLEVSSVKEENILDWNIVLKKIQVSFGNDVFESWIKSIILKKKHSAERFLFARDYS